MTKTYLLNQLCEKMQSPDQDFRFMALNDLMNEINQDPNTYSGDEAQEFKTLQQVLKLVEDKISEVKNQAVKCLGQMISLLREHHLDLVVDRLIDFFGGKDDELRDISGLALKTITSALPDGIVASKACGKLAPKLLHQLKNADSPPETLIETLAILSILITRFPANMSGAALQPQPLSVLVPLLSHSRPAVRKRAIVTLAQFVPLSGPTVFPEFLRSTVIPSLTSSSLDVQRSMAQLVGAVARYSPGSIGAALGEIVPGLLKASTKDDAELRESSIQALETLVLRCPSEITPFLSSIIGVGLEMIKYDPNYAADDEDEEMGDGGEDDDDDELDDAYSDDEDTSYKIRRSATKLLAAIIGTRPELLLNLYKNVSPVLISRFGDREESVRVEVWATYVLLLSNTAVYGGTQQESVVGGKRKRDEGMDVEDTPYSLLRSQVPSLSKALVKQLQPKASSASLQAGFNLLIELVTVLPGSLAASAPAVVTAVKQVLTQTVTTTTSTLYSTCLSFMALFFASHPQSTFSSSLPTILPTLLKALGEKHPRVVSESFRVFSALLNTLKPVRSGEWVDQVYAEAVKRLKSNDTDSEVRTRVEDIIADLWICAGEVVKDKGGAEWEALMRGTRSEGAVRVVEKVAKGVTISDTWVNEAVQWVLGVLKKTGRGGRMEAFACLAALLGRYQSGIPSNIPSSLIPQLLPYVNTSDLSLLALSLNILATLLQISPKDSFPPIESQVLPMIYQLAPSPLVSGTSLDALLAFIGALVEADDQIANHVIPGLVISLEKGKSGEGSATNVSKCVSRVVQSERSLAAGTIAQFAKSIKKDSKATDSHLVLCLFTLGEIGRYIDMSQQSEVFYNTLEFFTSDSEQVRSAASFAAGNIAIGNTHQFLPVIVAQVQSSSEKRLLSLHALKEVVTHCSQHQLEGIADALWVPLFDNSQTAEEATRNVAAACLGKLTTTKPARYLPQLQSRLRDPKAEIRATVLSAIRYTFADTAQSYDELLSPLIVEFLSLTLDQDLTVRRLTLSTLNAAARNKPHLIRDHLSSLLPLLYAETTPKPELIRVVQMGPWQHRVDDGLEARKTAYETMYTLLDTSLSRIDVHEFLTRVLAGLADEANEIKVLCYMMLFRLSQVASTAVAQRLDDATPELEKTMKGAVVNKDTVKQDLERAAELQRSALRAIAGLSKLRSPVVSPRFDAFVEELEKGSWASELKELRGPTM